MSESGGNLSALFSSLGPDDTSLRATTSAAAQEAEQRWPLLRAVSPKKSESTPVLSAQERRLWGSQEKSGVSEYRPALSLPGLSEKLARTLSKISEQTLAEVVRPTTRIAPITSVSASQSSVQKFSQETPPNSRSTLSERPLTMTQNDVVKNNTEGMFEKIMAKPSTLERNLPGAKGVDDSLVNIFNRLEEKEPVVSRPTERRSSFLGRLEKR